MFVRFTLFGATMFDKLLCEYWLVNNWAMSLTGNLNPLIDSKINGVGQAVFSWVYKAIPQQIVKTIIIKTLNFLFMFLFIIFIMLVIINLSLFELFYQIQLITSKYKKSNRS